CARSAYGNYIDYW
nr:immunoglobulin heavy chain junction region [Mus musculus]